MSEIESEPCRHLGRRFWGLNVTVWSLFVAAVATAIYADALRSGRAASWLDIIGRYSVYYLPWLLISPLVFRWVHRHPLARQGWRRQGGWYLLFFVVWLGPYILIESALASLLNYGDLRSIQQAFGLIPLNGWVLDSVFLLTLFGVANARDMTAAARSQERDAARLAIENAELSAGLSEARLQMLRAQLEPHFLFNSLNAITALIRSAEPETAVRAVGLLSELLRYATHAAASSWVSLEDEIDFVDAYLGFQQLRHGERLICDLDIEEGVGQARIPPLILQPLLENAIRHGVERLETPSRVQLRVHRRHDELVIAVTNAPAPETVGPSGLGVGLANSRERLQMIYGRQVDFRMSTTAEGFSVQVGLPWRQDDR